MSEENKAGTPPVAWARQCDLDEPDPAIFVAREEVEESGYVVALYTHADTGEVERLRYAKMQMKEQRDSERRISCALEEERDTLRQQLAERDALLRKARRYVERAWPDGVHSYRRNSIGGDLLGEIDALLSASAEPAKPQLVECDACHTSAGCLNEYVKAPADEVQS